MAVADKATGAYVGGLDFALKTGMQMRFVRYFMAAVFVMAASGLQPASGGGGRAQAPAIVSATDSSWRIEMTGETFSVWAIEAERLEMLNEIARLSGAALGGGKALAGRVTFSATHASVEEVLARLLDNTDRFPARLGKTGRPLEFARADYKYLREACGRQIDLRARRHVRHSISALEAPHRLRP